MLVQNYFHHDYSIQSLGPHKRLPTTDASKIRTGGRLIQISWIDRVTESLNISNALPTCRLWIQFATNVLFSRWYFKDHLG